MPDALTYPGVYIQELASGVHAIAGVSTSATAFVDCFARGPVGQAVRVTSQTEFNRRFGGTSGTSEGSYAVGQFFLNGGGAAWIVRVATALPAAGANPAVPPAAATAVLRGGNNSKDVLRAAAASVGIWGNQLRVSATQTTPPGQAPDTAKFNLVIQEVQAGNPSVVVATETFNNLVMDPASPAYAPAVVNAASQLATLTSLLTAPDTTPPDQGKPAVSLANGADGGPPDAAGLKAALGALDRIAPEIFNLLCIPAAANLSKADYADVVNTAVAFCLARRAFMLVDIPTGLTDPAKMLTWANDYGITPSPNAAVYFPRLLVPDGGQMRNVGSGGTMAGIYARTDATPGVWKAPAGVDATLVNATLTQVLTDGENGSLNPYGINVLRTFPVYGTVAWGARTLVGSDQLGSDWKYVPVRRLTLFIEESLYQGLRWAVFEPNDETLWTALRNTVDEFMAGLLREGAFAGTTPAQAYAVKCDAETTTPTDVNLGIVNVLVAFAPVKPAEFVVLTIQQIAGQAGA